MTASPVVPFPDSDAFRQRLQICADKVGNISKLSKATGLPQSTIRHYFEKGEPNRHNLLAIARAAQVSVEWLASGAGTPAADVALSSESLENEQAFQQRFDQILTTHGGISGLASVTSIHPDRLAYVKAGGELNREELRTLTKHTGISIEWLLNGHDNRAKTQNKNDAESVQATTHAIDRQSLLGLLSEGIIHPASWTIDASDQLDTARKVLSQLPPGPLISIVLDNKSMEPALHKGNLLIFSPQNSITQPGVYLIKDTHTRLVVANATLKGAHILYSYENRSFSEIGVFEHPQTSIQCLGKLVAHLIAD